MIGRDGIKRGKKSSRLAAKFWSIRLRATPRSFGTDRTRRATGRDKLRRPTVPQAKLPVAYPYWEAPAAAATGKARQGIMRAETEHSRQPSRTETEL